MNVQNYNKNGQIVSRFFKKTSDSFFLFGPRGVGKSTLLKKIFPKSYWIDLLQPDQYQTFITHPEHLREIARGKKNISTIVIDEIQKAPELLSVVHSLIEENKNLQFVLTGSSARKLKQEGTNLLAGRAILRHLHPFLARELGELFSLEKALKIGLMPLIFMSENPEEKLSTYISLYIKEEVQFEGLTRNVGNFARFLETISFSQGSVLNLSNIARESQVERKTVERYVGILEDILLSFSLTVFSKKAKRNLLSKKKFYFADLGIYRQLRPTGVLDRFEEIEGIALESLVAQHLRAFVSYNQKKFNLYYWQTYYGIEVDFIVYGDDVFWAIEVKNSKKVSTKDLRGLKAFRKEYPQSKAVLLYRGQETFERDGILCRPCEEFLGELGI